MDSKYLIVILVSILIFCLLMTAKSNNSPHFLQLSTDALPSTNDLNFIPARLEWEQPNLDTLILSVSNKDGIIKNTNNFVQLVFGIDLDGKKQTGEEWPQLGAEILLVVNNNAGRWSSSLKELATGKTIPLEKTQIDQKRIIIELPLSFLNYPTMLRTQLALSNGNEKYVFKELALITLQQKLQCCLPAANK